MEVGNDNGFIENLFKNIKSEYILTYIFNNLNEKKFLQIIKYNKILQKRLNKDINDYKAYNQIEIEIFPNKIYNKNIFINIPEKDKPYYHIYLNDNKEELKQNFFIKEKNDNKIKVLIDYEVKSLYGLFKDCYNIEKINFIRFNRKDINDMRKMFSSCASLKELNFISFNSDNITDMSYMFNNCTSLKKLNLDKFNTNNVTDMSYMFCNCSLLKELNINSFNTHNVTNMSFMFFNCSSLKELNSKKLDTKNVTNMQGMLNECSDEMKNRINSLITAS